MIVSTKVLQLPLEILEYRIPKISSKVLQRYNSSAPFPLFFGGLPQQEIPKKLGWTEVTDLLARSASLSGGS